MWDIADETRSGGVNVLYLSSDRQRGEKRSARLSEQDSQLSVASESDVEAVLNGDLAAFDCIVSEYYLPDCTGIECCDRLRHRGETTPYILHPVDAELTASQALDASVDAYVRPGTDEYAVLAERIQTHVELSRTRERCQQIEQEHSLWTEIASNIFWTHDIESGTFIVQNGIEQFGYTPDDVSEYVDWWFERIHPDDRDRVQSNYESLISGDRSFLDSFTGDRGRIDDELQWQRADGSYSVILLRVLCLFEDGEPVCLFGSGTDITDKRKTEQRFETIVNQSPTAISVLDENGCYQYISPSNERVFGYDADHLRGKSAFDLIHPDDRDRARDALQDLIEHQGSITRDIEMRMKSVDGSWIWVHAVGTTQTDTELDGYLVNVTNIDERKQKEQELERTKRQYDAILEGRDAYIVLLDTDSAVLRANESALKFIETTADDVVGKPIWETPWVTSADLSEQQFREYFKRVTDGAYIRFDATYPLENDQQMTLDLVTQPVTDGNDVEAVMVIGRNITEQKRHQRALNELHEATREFTEAEDKATVAVLAVDAVGTFTDDKVAAIWLYDESTDSLQPAAVSERAREKFGELPAYTGEGSVSWEVFKYQEHRRYGDIGISDSRYNEETEIRSEIVLSLGEYGVMNIGATAQNAFDEETFTLARLLAANTEAALQRAEREDTLRDQRSRLKRQKDRFETVATIISHDLRNPLNVASTRLTLLREDTDSSHLDDIENALSRMEGIIEDVLTFARDGQTATNKTKIDIAGLALQCWTVVDTPDATLSVRDDISIRASEKRLRHILENLFRNAVEHSVGDVTVTIGALEDGFYVEDDGPGIAPESSEDIFELGYTTETGGTGFGLTIVETVADAHGWEVAVTEGSDGGARFEFRSVDVSD